LRESLARADAKGLCTCRCVSPGCACGYERVFDGSLNEKFSHEFVLGWATGRTVSSPRWPALAHDGLHVAEGTLAGVFAACSDLLVPLAAAYRGAIDSIDFVPRHACCGRSRRRALPQGV
jgi:hypothetical protein